MRRLGAARVGPVDARWERRGGMEGVRARGVTRAACGCVVQAVVAEAAAAKAEEVAAAAMLAAEAAVKEEMQVGGADRAGGCRAVRRRRGAGLGRSGAVRSHAAGRVRHSPAATRGVLGSRAPVSLLAAAAGGGGGQGDADRAGEDALHPQGARERLPDGLQRGLTRTRGRPAGGGARWRCASWRRSWG
jgi:hypothetical protein